MRSRREQVQAYRFLIRRIVSALLAGEPETNELPMRRFALAMLGGLLVGVLLIAGFGVYGLLRPGGRQPVENAIIVQRDTGAKFIYSQGRLHPVLNWTSALLIIGQPEPAVRTMSESSLRAVPRGLPIGIPDAPDSLPSRSALLGLPISVCSAPRSLTSVARATHVLLGRAPSGGTAVGRQGLLVSVDGGDRFLLWAEHRLRIRGNAVLAALGWAGIPPVAVGEAFLNSVPPGPDLVPLALPGAGSSARPTIGGQRTRIGQLFRAAGKSYVMLSDGLAPIGAVTARLLEAAGRTVNEISAQQAGELIVDSAAEPPGLPDEVPEVRGAQNPVPMVCASYHDDGGAAEHPVIIETFGSVPGDVPPVEQPATAAGADGIRPADRVALPGGHAALVRAANPIGANAAGNVYLVTDQGLKFPLSRPNLEKVQSSLGYAGVRPVQVPASILALVPTGVALDPEAAVRLSPLPTVAPADPGGRPAGGPGAPAPGPS
ncbi:type VII secretion protein EccB [Plantactinospora sp. KLBMP9567]|uniref:type VII secretion protein EccB n=1 Tax=Plantactinospora sp. KLBMP9567 TaxID=3085900 RepID=UPI0029818047|nr:type VII secretion protein EccB [Plantactinospora sp. KLBMP9567]MDW5327950.1 type VII secretion protein EccB [Plantactinospora sp. KLBMP9567]